MKSIYEEAGGTYTRQGDYELPNLKVSPEKEIEIGVLGQRYRRYLKQYHKIRYYNLLTSGTLNGHLAEVDQQAERMFQLLVSVLSKQENVTEELKAKHPMEWVQKMNTPPETVPLDRTNGAAKPLKWCMVTAAMVH